MKKNSLILLPVPKKCEYRPGELLIKNLSAITIPYEDKQGLFNVAKRLKEIVKSALNLEMPLHILKQDEKNPAVAFLPERCCNTEEYSIEINENQINIRYGRNAGAFHAVSTLKQIILQCGTSLPCLFIEDKPDFPVRGLMLDIGRDKIPSMHTLFQIIDIIADLKLNHFELYIQGFPFAYSSFPQVWSNGTPVTGEEMIALDRYCKERFIDFVPNQNSFGHMSPWLARKEFNHLAECPNGSVAPWGPTDKPLGLNPLDEECIEFLRKTYADLLPYFDSGFFNVGCDETHDLGQGKSRELCEKVGKGKVYLDFLKKIQALVKEHNKTMMFWGDIILKYPELIPEIPGEAIALLWGYGEEKPYEDNCIKFENANIPFYICPSVNTTNSIIGKTTTMVRNMHNAAIRGKNHGAIGYLITDWGDYGHWQPLSASFAGYCLGSALSWGVEQNTGIDVAPYLNKFIFKDRNEKMGQLALDAGNSCIPKQTSKQINMTGIFWLLYFSQLDESQNPIPSIQLQNLDAEYYSQVKENAVHLLEELNNVDMKCDDSEIIDAEYRVSLLLIQHGAELGLFKLSCSMGMEKNEKQKKLEYLINDITAIIKDYKINWLRRNRIGGLDESVKRLESLKNQYNTELKKL